MRGGKCRRLLFALHCEAGVGMSIAGLINSISYMKASELINL